MPSLSATLNFLKQSNATATPSSSSNDQNQQQQQKPLHIAIEGCSHGELDKIYAECLRHEQETGKKIDLLICCGDFQSVRSGEKLQKLDLESMHVPKKFLSTGDFPKYFSGEKKAPVKTCLIGGNHEASHFLFEEYYGGYLCENIYYLGHSGVINVGGLRIAGLSGIYKYHDFEREYPVPPYHGDQSKIIGAYHVRKFEIEKLMKLQQREDDDQDDKIDIFISHDWPVGVTDFGNEETLLQKKPYFEEDIEKKRLGNPHTMKLLKALKPRYWFAAHLHVRFQATIHHDSASNDEMTKFLALDKCVRSTHEFLEFMDILPSTTRRTKNNSNSIQQQQQQYRDPFDNNQLIIFHDPKWVDIIRQTHLQVPLDLSSGALEEDEKDQVPWIRDSILPLLEGSLKMPDGRRREREAEDDGDHEGNNHTNNRMMMIRASNTIDLLKAMGLAGDGCAKNQSKIVSKQKQNQVPPPPVPSTTTTRNANDDDDNSAVGGDCLGWSEDV